MRGTKEKTRGVGDTISASNRTVNYAINDDDETSRLNVQNETI